MNQNNCGVECPSSVALLLSRQSLRPTAQCGWVKQIGLALDWVAANNYSGVSSIGLQTWEMVTALAARRQIPLTIVIPAHSESEFLDRAKKACVDFALEYDAVTWDAAITGDDADPAAQMSARDQRVVELAGILMPISLRTTSTLAAKMEQSSRAGQRIDHRFAIAYEPRDEPLVVTIDHRKLNPHLLAIQDQYLIHWTRGSNSAWPNERALDYYIAISQSNEWARSGLATLKRIVAERRLIGSSRHMPARQPCVSFSSLPPRNVIGLMKWRARYTQMSFEPYGLGLRKEAAMRLGIQRVVYYDREGVRVVRHDREDWRMQSTGKITDWRKEQEFRHRGDLDFSNLRAEDIMLFCHYSREAEILRREFSLPVTEFEQ